MGIVDEKNKNNNNRNTLDLKLRVMFYLGNLLRTTGQETASQIALRDSSKQVREEPRYRGVFAEKKKKCSQTSKDYC